jgi:hypothetical protein
VLLLDEHRQPGRSRGTPGRRRDVEVEVGGQSQVVSPPREHSSSSSSCRGRSTTCAFAIDTDGIKHPLGFKDRSAAIGEWRNRGQDLADPS